MDKTFKVIYSDRVGLLAKKVIIVQAFNAAEARSIARKELGSEAYIKDIVEM